MTDLVERPVTIDIIIAWHKKQAEHFGPFGAHNALTVFHSGAAIEIERLRAKNAQLLFENVGLHSFVAGAFEAHPNLDLDIDAARASVKGE